MAKSNNFNFFTHPFYTADKPDAGYFITEGDQVEVEYGQQKKVLIGEVLDVLHTELLLKTKFGNMKYKWKNVKRLVIGKDRKPDLNAVELQERLRELRNG